MVLAVVTEIPLPLAAVEPDPFIDPPPSVDVPPAVDVMARHAAADTAVTAMDKRVLTRAD